MDGPVPDPRALRISDDDRHQVAEVLRQAAGEGRLDLEELDQRLEAAYGAKTYGELVPITADLPLAGPRPTPGGLARPVPPRGPAVRHSVSLAVMSETRRLGPWVLADGHTAFALMGSVVLDLREAVFDRDDLTLWASAVMGEVTIVVDASTRVVLEGFAVMGEYRQQRERVAFDPTGAGPVVRVRGLALMGAVRVVRKGPPTVRGRARVPRLG